MYMEPRHFNFEEFLDLKETNGNDYVRTRSLNTACRIPDEFMQRVLDDADRYMFDPNEVEILTETWGEEFSKHYNEFVAKAEKGEMTMVRTMRARELYRLMLIQAAKTGNYWLTFKDTHNRDNAAPSYANIHSSNLCTEISIPNREDSTAVCTLASINLSRSLVSKWASAKIDEMSLDEKLNLIDWEGLKESASLAIRALDNVLDINFYPSEASKQNSMDLRPLGLGVM